MAHLPLRRSRAEGCRLQRELRQTDRRLHPTVIVNEPQVTYGSCSQIMSYIFNILICVCMILLDNLLQCFLFIAMIHLSRTCGTATSLIMNYHSYEQKTLNMVVSSSGGGTSGYGNLPYVLSVFQFTTWWLDSGANVHVCFDASLFSSYQVARDSSVLIGNESHAPVRGVGTIHLKLTSGKIVQLKNAQYVPSINKNLVSDSLLCRDGFKVVLESNKFVMSKYGQIIGKAMCAEACFVFQFLIAVISL
jgi:hypothetical protein